MTLALGLSLKRLRKNRRMKGYCSVSVYEVCFPRSTKIQFLVEDAPPEYRNLGRHAFLRGLIEALDRLIKEHEK